MKEPAKYKLNRAQRRKIKGLMENSDKDQIAKIVDFLDKKKLKDQTTVLASKETLEEISDKLNQAGFGESFPEGTLVRINPETVTKGNSKRDRWVEAHINDVLTIEYDPRWGVDPSIFCLKEDDSDPKWWFTKYELIKVELVKTEEE